MYMRKSIIVGALTGLAIVAAVSAQGQAAKSRAAWSVPRTEDGRPDLQGVWANNNMTPLERPKQFGGRATMSDAELADLKVKVKALLDGGDAFFFDELVLAALEGKDKFRSADTQTGNYDQSWLSERVFDNRTSLIIDPPDGRIPAPAPGFPERARARAAAARQGRGPADSAQDLGLSTRCVHFGTPNLMAGYQSYFELTQSPDHVVVKTEMIHDARVIPLDGRPHVSSKITQYHGDSRGHWEGDTLVVDTTNFSPNTSFRGSTDGLHLIEKFRRVADDTVEYSITIEDPAVWSRPWTLMIPLKKTGEQMFEYACHEGNYGLPAILRGARAQEQAASRR
jgi:hypothetical protein